MDGKTFCKFSANTNGAVYPDMVIAFVALTYIGFLFEIMTGVLHIEENCELDCHLYERDLC